MDHRGPTRKSVEYLKPHAVLIPGEDTSSVEIHVNHVSALR